MLSLSSSLVAVGLRSHPFHRYWTLLPNIFCLKLTDILSKGNLVILWIPTLTCIILYHCIVYSGSFSISDVFLSINNKFTSHWNGIVSRILWRSWDRKQKTSVRLRWCHGWLPKLLRTRWYSIPNVSSELNGSYKEQNALFKSISYSASP